MTHIGTPQRDDFKYTARLVCEHAHDFFHCVLGGGLRLVVGGLVSAAILAVQS